MCTGVSGRGPGAASSHSDLIAGSPAWLRQIPVQAPAELWLPRAGKPCPRSHLTHRGDLSNAPMSRGDSYGNKCSGPDVCLSCNRCWTRSTACIRTFQPSLPRSSTRAACATGRARKPAQPAPGTSMLCALTAPPPLSHPHMF